MARRVAIWEGTAGWTWRLEDTDHQTIIAGSHRPFAREADCYADATAVLGDLSPTYPDTAGHTRYAVRTMP